jgi:hypothetical protein
MGAIVINGNTYIGSSIIISNNKVIVNGQDVTPDGKEINIKVEGNINELKVDACNNINVNGDVQSVSTKSGDIDVSGNVNGSVSTISGDVNCGSVGGSISTISGDIKHRR